MAAGHGEAARGPGRGCRVRIWPLERCQHSIAGPTHNAGRRGEVALGRVYAEDAAQYREVKGCTRHDTLSVFVAVVAADVEELPEGVAEDATHE